MDEFSFQKACFTLYRVARRMTRQDTDYRIELNPMVFRIKR